MTRKAKWPTAAQRKVLKMLESGGYCTHVAAYRNGYGVRINSASVRALDKAGLIAPMKLTPHCFELTVAGRRALEEPKP